MARTNEMELPISDKYRELLRSLIGGLGRDRIAELAGIDSATVHRNVNEGRLTYTTAMKLRDAVRRAHRADHGDELMWLPPPFAPVVSQAHYDLCDLAARLHGLDQKLFQELLDKALELTHRAERERALESVNQRIAHPLRNPDDD